MNDEQIISIYQKLILLLQEYYLLLKNKMSNTPSKDPAILERFLKAIEVFEGYKPGSRSYRNNNPGNIRYIGQEGATRDPQNFAIFPTYKAGYDALKRLVKNAATGRSKIYSPEDTIFGFFSKYAPSEDSNDPEAYARFVAERTGVPVETKMKDLV